MIEVYFDGRDEKGRFVVGHVPWNKTSSELVESLRRRYGIKPPDKPYEELGIDEKQRLYRLALRIRAETGYGKTVIAKVLGISPTTVHNWLYRGSRPRLNYTPIDTTPSAELAYVVGVILGDGNVQKDQRHYDVRLITKDEEFALEFKKNLSKLLRGGKIRLYRRRDKRPGRSPLWVVEACSKALYDYIRALSPYSLRELSFAYPSEFLRGFFDSEGGVYIIKGRWGMVYADNTDKRLLELVCQVASEKFNIQFKMRPEKRKARKGRRPVYRIAIYRRDQILLFYRNIGFTIKRKAERLKRLVEVFNR